MNQNELYHYGVKGMKWGVRKDKNKTSKKKTARTPEEIKEQYQQDNYNILKRAAGRSRRITSKERDLYEVPYLRETWEDVQVKRQRVQNFEDNYGNKRKNVSDIEYETARQQYREADSLCREIMKESINQFLGKYGDKRIKDVENSWLVDEGEKGLLAKTSMNIRMKYYMDYGMTNYGSTDWDD